MTESKQFKELRERAVQQVEQKIPDNLDGISADGIADLLHELRVHQVELEIQNQELIESQEKLLTSSKELKKTHDRFFQLFHDAPVGYVVLDRSSMIQEANRSFSRMTGMSYDNVIGKPFVNYIASHDQAIFRSRFKSFTKNPEGKLIEVSIDNLKDKSSKVMQLEGKLVDWPDLKAGEYPLGNQLLVTITDIDQQKQYEKQLIEARQRAEEASYAKTEFLSRMSHELRTPMNAILGFSQLIAASGDSTDKIKKQISSVLKAGTHLLNLIDEVLDISKINAGKIEINLASVDVNEILESSLSIVSSSAEQYKVNIDPVPHVPHYVLADKQRLKQVMINLLSNAVKYNKAGGLVAIRYKLMSPQAGQAQTLIRLEVSDTGIGIKDEDKYRLFKPFERLMLTDQWVDGTGIGLTICKSITELMGGDIGFESKYGRGSRFWVDLPIAIEKPQQEIDNKKLTHYQEKSRQKILYIEDTRQSANLMIDLVDSLTSHQCVWAATPEEGLKLAVDDPPDLIILDIQLPEMDGYEVLKLLKENPQTTTIPVVGLSADALDKDVEMASASDFNEYITKPFDIDHMVDVIEKYLD